MLMASSYIHQFTFLAAQESEEFLRVGLLPEQLQDAVWHIVVGERNPDVVDLVEDVRLLDPVACRLCLTSQDDRVVFLLVLFEFLTSLFRLL